MLDLPIEVDPLALAEHVAESRSRDHDGKQRRLGLDRGRHYGQLQVELEVKLVASAFTELRAFESKEGAPTFSRNSLDTRDSLGKPYLSHRTE